MSGLVRGGGGRFLAALLGLVLVGCGYRFTARADALPTSGKRVFAPAFENDTAEAGIEAEFTNAFRAELANAHADGDARSAVRALGSLSALGGGPELLRTDERGNPVALASYTTGITLCVRLVEGPKPLGSACVNGSEDYAPGGDPLQTEAARRLALRRLAQRLAREVFEHLASGF